MTDQNTPKKRVLTYQRVGFARDYYVAGKYAGYVTLQKPDRNLRGYYGRQVETLQQDVVLKHSGKVLKAGLVVTTELIEMQGRIKLK